MAEAAHVAIRVPTAPVLLAYGASAVGAVRSGRRCMRPGGEEVFDQCRAASSVPEARVKSGRAGEGTAESERLSDRRQSSVTRRVRP